MNPTTKNNGTYLIINPGSTSTCYVLNKNNHEVAYAYFLNRFSTCEATYRSQGQEKTVTISYHDYEQSGGLFLNYLRQLNIINNHNDITHVGLRVVAPGTFFTQHCTIDGDYITKLKDTAHLDPLHIDPLIKQINLFKKLLPASVFYGLSDSAFHQTMPEVARIYALPESTMSELDMYRFGYHGLACSSVMRKLANQHGKFPENIVICHLGGGTSITAIKNGKSIDTSMGFSPLEGLPMATRSGNVDPNVLLNIMQQNNLNHDEMRNFLYTKCGLLGISGKSGDMRQLEAAAKEGNAKSILAIDLYTYAIRKYIGAYATILGGLDLLVLTGGISVYLPFIRERICNNLNLFDVKLDETKNKGTVARDGFIEAPNSAVKIAVLAPDEEQEMYLILKTI